MTNGGELILDSIYYKEYELYGLLRRPKKKEKIQKSEIKYDINNRPYTVTYNIPIKTKVEIKIEEDRIVKIRLQNVPISRSRTAFLVIIMIPVAIGLIFFIAASLPGCEGYFCL